VLTIVGDVEPDAAFAAVERYFGPLPAAPSGSPAQPSAEPLAPLAHPVRLERLGEVPNDRLYLAWRLPVDTTDEFLAASLAVDVLGGLGTSRLVQRLVRDEQSATAVHAHAMGFVGGASLGLLILDVAAGVDPAAVEAAVGEELDRLIADGVEDIEMESALAETERSWLSALASQEERADLICHYALLADDPRYVNGLLDRYTAVTADQVQAAVAAYLRPESRAVVSYLVREQEAAA
jgi:zinc protease